MNFVQEQLIRQHTNTIQILWIVKKIYDVPNNNRYRFAATKNEKIITQIIISLVLIRQEGTQGGS